MRKKLIEVALPLEAINAASAREKSIRHGHPSTLHLGFVARIKMRCCGRSDVICFFCNEKEIHVPHPQLERV